MKIECALCMSEDMKIYGFFGDQMTLKYRCLNCGAQSENPKPLEIKQPEIWKKRATQ